LKTYNLQNGILVHYALFGRSNVFLISDGKKNILVDTGRRKHFNYLLNNLKRLEVSKIDLLILTHSHFDHAENCAALKSIFHCPVLIHKNEASFLSTGNSPLPYGSIAITRFATNLLIPLIGGKFAYAPQKADIIVEDDYNLNIGTCTKIINTPGHSIGSISVIIENQIAITGDAMFGVFPNTVYPPFADDKKGMVESWKKLIDTGCDTFLPSHGTAKPRVVAQKTYNKFKSAF